MILEEARAAVFSAPAGSPWFFKPSRPGHGLDAGESGLGQDAARDIGAESRTAIGHDVFSLCQIRDISVQNVRQGNMPCTLHMTALPFSIGAHIQKHSRRAFLYRFAIRS